MSFEVAFVGSTCAPVSFFLSRQPRSSLLSPVINAAAPQGDRVTVNVSIGAEEATHERRALTRNRRKTGELSCGPN